MRVLHVTPYFAPAFIYGGPPRSILGLCKAQRRAGVDVEVLTTDADGDGTLPPAVTMFAEYDGVPARYFPRTSRALFTAPALVDALRHALPSCDLIHIHGLWNRVAWDAAREARRAGVPYVVSPRGMLEPAALAHHQWRKRIVWPLFDRPAISGAALLHATSTEEQATLEQRFPSARVVMAPNGVDLPDRLKPIALTLRRSLALPAEGPIVLYLGRLHPIKRLDLLSAAFRRLHTTHADATLVIAGPDESGYRATIEPLLADVAHRVIWAGAVDEEQKNALLAVASMLVLCSNTESFGMSVVEAMAAAVPVVVTRTCPWADVAHHDTGAWVEHDADAIADAMRALLDDPDKARAKGERGRALVAAQYTWDSVARTLIGAYEEVRATVTV
jgi:glycosyltransferase involved in cell wall biosynthesis